MTKLRSRLLVSLVLAAVTLAAAGVSVASARPHQRQAKSWAVSNTASRPGVGPCSGEPDPSGSGAPIPAPVMRSSMTRQPNLWLAQLLTSWWTRGHFAQHRTGR